MNCPTIHQVEDAVRSVLDDIGRKAREGEVFAGRLFGAKDAEVIRCASAELTIEVGTVVTPLALEILKRRGIAIRRVAACESSRDGQWGFVVEASSGISQACQRSLRELQPPWIEPGQDHRDVALWVSQRSDRAGALITDEPALATWWACRLAGVRAATASTPSSIARAVRSIGANLLVIDAEGLSVASIRHLLTTYRRLGVPSGIGVHDEDRRGDRPGHAVSGSPELAQRALADRETLDLRGDRGRLPATR